jgi:short-subunit dehydrogenase
MYASTKAFVSQFAASLAIEVRNNGVDVIAVHPSPVASNFYDKAHKLDSLDIAQKSAVSPSSVPNLILSCVGRCHLGDLGNFAIMVRSIVAMFPYDFLAGMFSFASPYMDDYKKYNVNRGVTSS